MRRVIVAAIAVLLLGGVAASPSAAQEGPEWTPGLESAVGWARERRGEVSIAVLDEGGRLHSYRGRSLAGTASLLKPLLMAAYLRRPGVRDRPLRLADRRLLSPMIRRSANGPATAILDRLGAGYVERTARELGMARLRIRRPWGLSTTTAIDQVRYFERYEAALPERHRAYARSLLSSIVPSQRWGIARVVPAGWELLFKGGWGSGTGRFCHQSALLERDGRRVVLSVLSEHSPSHRYGTRTLRGVFARLLHGLR